MQLGADGDVDTIFFGIVGIDVVAITVIVGPLPEGKVMINRVNCRSGQTIIAIRS